MDKFKSLLDKYGFAEHEQISHFGQCYSHVYYAFRHLKRQNDLPLFEYVSLVSHDGKFCEAVYEAFIAKKNSFNPKGKDEKGEKEKYSKFQKSGQKTVFAMIYRDLERLENKMKFEEEKQNQILTIKLFDYRLTESNLDALASEFLGSVLANFKASTGEIGIEFDNEENLKEFKNALECFKIDFGDKK